MWDYSYSYTFIIGKGTITLAHRKPHLKLELRLQILQAPAEPTLRQGELVAALAELRGSGRTAVSVNWGGSLTDALGIL